MRRALDIAWVMVVLATGCTMPARTTTLERDQSRLQEQVVALQAKVTELESKVATLNKRLGAAVTGKGTPRPVEQRSSTVDERLGVVETDARVSADPVGPRTAAPTPTPTALPELDVDGLRRDASRQLPSGYNRGIALLRGGHYEQAIQVMRDFVRAEHDSPFAVGAHYWIGQAHMQLGQFYQAILAFTDVQQRAPRSEYAPVASLASGTAFLQLGNVTEARRAFERVLAENPGTPEAAKAATRLRALDRAR